MHDYVLHYLDLFDALGRRQVPAGRLFARRLLAAKFAMEHGRRVERLVLVGPAGLRGQARPTSDVLSLPPEQIPAMLVTNFDVIKPYLPEGPDLDFMGDRYREGGTLARLLWEHPYDLKISRAICTG
jgi:pimeloyl-ACP methyl ester carboxylesterase